MYRLLTVTSDVRLSSRLSQVIGLGLSLSIIICIVCIVGCGVEERAPESSNLNLTPIKERRDQGTEEQWSDASSLDQMLPPDQMPPRQDLSLLDDEGVEQDQAIPLDLALDMSPDALPIDQDVMPEDMELPCQDGARQTGETCGFEECISGVWVQVSADYEFCNGHDDNCNGVIDESPVPDSTSSTCCTDQVCLIGSYCDQGQCVGLDEGECRLPDDCESYEECEEETCVISHIIQPPAFPRSCNNPIEISSTSTSVNSSIDPIVISGDLSDDQFYTQVIGECSPSRARREETQLGYELVFRFAPSGLLSRTYQIRALVRVNSVMIPSTLMVLSSCSTNTQADICFESPVADDASHQVSGQFVARPDSTYFIVLDTYGTQLQQELLTQQAQYSDVHYEISIYTR
jgi:hypothetical protein